MRLYYEVSGVNLLKPGILIKFILMSGLRGCGTLKKEIFINITFFGLRVIGKID